MPTFVDLQNKIAFDLRGLQTAVETGIADQIKSAINLAINHYSAELFWFNTRTSYTLTNTNQPLADYISLPMDYKAVTADPSIIDLTHDTVRKTLQHKGDDDIELINQQGNKSMPRFYCITGNQLRVGPIPDKTYKIQINYIKSYPVLVADMDTNDWLDNAEDLIRFYADRRLATLPLRNTQLANEMQIFTQEALQSLRYKTIDYLAVEGIRPNDL